MKFNRGKGRMVALVGDRRGQRGDLLCRQGSRLLVVELDVNQEWGLAAEKVTAILGCLSKSVARVMIPSVLPL